MKENILITGGSGFIGSNLVDFFVKEGHDVYVIDDLSTGLEENHNNQASYFNYDIVNIIDDSRPIKEYIFKNKISIVYHLAASADIFLSINNPEKVYKINLDASVAILNACSKTNVKKFIFASTSAVYGEPEILPVSEDHKTNPISPYGLTKLGFEQYMNFFQINSDIEMVALRFPNVYGFRQRSDLEGGVLAIFEDVMKNNEQIKIFGDGNQTRDWVDVRDIVIALDIAKGYSGKFNIMNLGSGKKTSINTLFNYFKNEMSYTKEPLYLDEREGDIKHMVMDCSRVFKQFKWRPTISLEDGVKNLVSRIIK